MLECTALKGRGRGVLTDKRSAVGLDAIGQMDEMGMKPCNILRRHAEMHSAEGQGQGSAHRRAL